MGKCYRASALAQYATLPSFTFSKYTEGFSIAFWFYFDVAAENTATELLHRSAKIFAFTSGSGANDTLSMGRDGMSLDARFSVRQGTQENTTIVSGGFPSRQRIHSTWCLQQTGNGSSTWYIYQNGVLNTTAASFLYPQRILTANDISWSPWAEAYQEGYFKGKLDEFGIYPFLLNLAEARLVFNSTAISVRSASPCMI